MDIKFCTQRCQISPNEQCKIFALNTTPIYYKDNKLDETVTLIIGKITNSKNKEFTLHFNKLNCFDNGLSGSYDVIINDTVITTVTFPTTDICIPYCCIYVLNQLRTGIEQLGFTSESSDKVLTPYSKLNFKKELAYKFL